ncbi:hypothetical protein BKA80DRAFT_118133 [Phyllosticta citrichinensis]
MQFTDCNITSLHTKENVFSVNLTKGGYLQTELQKTPVDDCQRLQPCSNPTPPVQRACSASRCNSQPSPTCTEQLLPACTTSRHSPSQGLLDT